MFREAQRVRDPALSLLVGVIDVLQAELLAITDQFQEIAGIVSSGYDQNVPDPGFDQSFNRVVDHGPVVDGQQVLVRDLGQRIKPRSQSSGKNDTLHWPTSPPGLPENEVPKIHVHFDGRPILTYRKP